MCMIMSAPLGLPGCAASDAPAAPDAPGEIIAAESFLADIARAVAGPELAVAGLLLPGIDPHAFQPRPRDVARLSKARLLLVAGHGYEAWLEPLRGSLAGVEIIGAFGPVERVGDVAREKFRDGFE
ncbi:MAG: metal ABC transporter solute-binding protein, Zn/Mn family, partial [Rectinemataceae bacterium]